MTSGRKHDVEPPSGRRPTGYDFVVVGAGTAGCVFASRRAQSAEATVLVLEAGRRESLDTAAEPAVSADINATDCGIAERAADLLLRGQTPACRAAPLPYGVLLNGCSTAAPARTIADTGPSTHRITSRGREVSSSMVTRTYRVCSWATLAGRGAVASGPRCRAAR
ncbi:hypothetical protein E4K10_39645 [Streptomyces sp. T1317-0309]|nr:hypothetical protein E4K10_39645 [Streptomyces sp. T1317-0309]